MKKYCGLILLVLLLVCLLIPAASATGESLPVLDSQMGAAEDVLVEAESQAGWLLSILVVLRIVLMLAAEGAVFYWVGYREKHSWIIFSVVNLITTGALNLFVAGAVAESYWILGYILGGIFVYIAEMYLFNVILVELSRTKALCYTLAGNGASLVLGALLFVILPM